MSIDPINNSTLDKFKYIDIHGHLNFSAYDPDREEVIKRTHALSVATVTVGTQLITSRKAVELAEQHDGMFATIGLHPIHTSASHHDIAELGEGGKTFTSLGEDLNEETLKAYRELAKHPKVVAIGECGLDYYRLDTDSAKKQVQVFEAMIDIANEVNKPLMLHIRNGTNKSAYNDALKILKSRSRVKGNLHFFAGSIEEAQPFLELGYTFSFTGVLTFTKDYDEIVRFLPLEKIMVETDCPYITPVPYRGKRNEPVYVIEVVKAIARIKGLNEELVRKQILENARNFIKIL